MRPLKATDFVKNACACVYAMLVFVAAATAARLEVVVDGEARPLQLSEAGEVQVELADGVRALLLSETLVISDWKSTDQLHAMLLPVVVVDGGSSGRPQDPEIDTKSAELTADGRGFVAEWIKQWCTEYPEACEPPARQLLLFGWMSADQFKILGMETLTKVANDYIPISGNFDVENADLASGHFAFVVYDLGAQELLKPLQQDVHSPLVKALLANDVPALEAALAGGADMTELSTFGWTPLQLAAGSRASAGLELLRRASTRQLNDTKAGWSPLHFAASRSNKEALDILIERGVDLDPVDSSRRTPLALAVLNGDREVVEMLLEAGAKARTVQGQDALIFAIDSEKDDLIPLLLENSEKFRLEREIARLLFLQAVSHDRLEAARLMLDIAKVRLDRKVEDIHIALLASQSASVDMLEMLRQAGMVVDVVADNGNRPIHIAAAENPQVIPWLLQHGQDPDSQSSEGRTPLLNAVAVGNMEAVSLLLEAGADPNVHFKDKHIIEWATAMARREAVSALVKSGAHCDFDPSRAIAALENAFRYDMPEVFSLTLDTCLSVDFAFDGDFPGWGVATRYGAGAIQELMLARGLTEPEKHELRLTSPQSLAAPLQPKQIPLPPYTYSMMRRHGEQIVRVNAIIDRKGRVRFPILSDDVVPELRDQILYLSQFWQFEPLELEEGYHGVQVIMPLRFSFDVPIYDISKIETPPKPISQARPTYPRPIGGKLLGGIVKMQFVVTDQGDVEPDSIETVSTFHPEYSKAAAKAIRKWKFEPGAIDGRAVHTRVAISIPFQIPSNRR